MSTGTRRGVFVTGTDTEVGKTIIAAALTRALCSRGMRVGVMKPVSAGRERKDGCWINEDARQLLEASNVPLTLSEINPYAFEPPISPHIAAAEAGLAVDLARIESAFIAIADKADLVVVEGAGGWLAPISETLTMADIAIRLALPVVLIVGMRLGCLNHSLLSAESIRSRGLTLAGWVANSIDPDFSRAKENHETLAGRLGAPLLGKVPFLASPRIATVQDGLMLDPLLSQLQ